MFGFDIFSDVFGYALGALFDLTGNYGVAVILFTLLVSLITFPIAIKRSRSMTLDEKFEAKKENLRKICGNDAQKFNREYMELAQKEGVNPFRGCTNISLILTIVIFSGIYSTIQKPLSSVLHLQKEKVLEATSVLTEEQRKQKGSDQLDLIRSFDDVKPKLKMFTNDELNKMDKLSKGFKFLGLNLLNIPKFSSFGEYLWVFPLLSFIFSAFGQYVMQKFSGIGNDVRGIGKYSIYIFSFFQAWIVSKVFAAVGLYFLVSNILGTLQFLLIERYFSVHILKARKESKLFLEILKID